MSEHPSIDELRDLILSGFYDSNLLDIEEDIRKRREATREFIEWVAGDRVKINARCRPKYLVGADATITGVRRSRVTIRLDKSQGRFTSERDITIPTELLDKVM